VTAKKNKLKLAKEASQEITALKNVRREYFFDALFVGF
jgi:hypothetical protein